MKETAPRGSSRDTCTSLTEKAREVAVSLLSWLMA
jgi:hypothetical protein